MAERPEALARLADKLVLAVCAVLAVWMMSWEEQVRVERGSAWAHRLTSPFEWATQVFSDFGAMRTENEQLRAEIQALRMDLEYLASVRARLEEMESRAGFYERNRGRLVPATVLELIVSRVPVQAKIRIFSDDSLRVWMPVVNEHGLVGRIVLEALDRRLELGDLTLDDYRKHSPLFEEDLYVAISLETSMSLKNVPGGTSPDRVREALLEARQRVEAG